MTRTKIGRRPTKRLLKLVAWMTWAASHAPGASIGERAALVEKLMTGLTEAEREQVEQLWPHDDYEIVRKPRARKPKRQPEQRRARIAGVLAGPHIINAGGETP
jgi:hypothetical protein